MPRPAAADARRAAPESSDTDITSVFRRLLETVAERPPMELDPDLDAALRSFARRGIRHSSVPHIARERGVSRATLYRRIGTVDDIARLVLDRELHRFLESLPDGGQGTVGAQGIVSFAAAVVGYAMDHTVFTKIREDEPDLYGRALESSSPIIELMADTLAPYLAEEMAAGRVRPASPRAVAQIVVRIVAAAIALPPPGEVEEHLADLLLPVLEP